jgi:translation initiation factor IF-3
LQTKKKEGSNIARKKPKNQNQQLRYRINEQIRANEVRVVGENVDDQGIYPLKEALKKADEAGLDLVEVSPKANPPVCKIIDYQKFLYQQKKKQKEMKSKTTKVVVKEIRFGPNTDEHDYNFKLNHAKKFLEDGAKVKAFVFFKGRSILFKEKGEILLLRLAQDLEEYGTVEKMPKLEGKRMTMFITPKTTKKK